MTCTCLSISRDPLCYYHGDADKVRELYAADAPAACHCGPRECLHPCNLRPGVRCKVQAACASEVEAALLAKIPKVRREMRCAVTLNRCNEFGCDKPGAHIMSADWRCDVCRAFELLGEVEAALAVPASSPPPGPNARETVRELRELSVSARGYDVRRVMRQAAVHIEHLMAEGAVPASSSPRPVCKCPASACACGHHETGGQP